ncbi:transposase [Phreatobacter oligotrophus]|jgi:transposase|uniref:transposase n=1 Tax=Phreatobacter oligotrophus TaxID=1122261 RepID=UPI000D38371B|nr:transposase [Phreatobacter oligotrophus]
MVAIGEALRSRASRKKAAKSRSFLVTDEQFRRIEPHVPTDTWGKASVDKRSVINDIVQVLEFGCRWIDAPA